MKKVDPSILVGTQTVLGGDEWDRVVYEGTAKNADFAIYHSYYPQVDSLEPRPGVQERDGRQLSRCAAGSAGFTAA